MLSNKQIDRQVYNIRIALDELKRVALEPDDIRVICWSGILTERVGTLVNYCLSHITEKLAGNDLETN